MGDVLLAATAHNATAPVTPPAVAATPSLSTDAGLSGASVQGVVQGSVPDAAQGAAASMPATSATQGLMDSAANATQAAGAAVHSAAGATGIPVESTFSWGGYFQAIAVLLLLLALLWGLVWAMRKYGKFNFMPRPGDFPRDELRVEAQVPLGPRKGLVVVRFLNRRLLLGVTDQHITFLTEAGHSNETDSVDFQGIMEEARRQKPDC